MTNNTTLEASDLTYLTAFDECLSGTARGAYVTRYDDPNLTYLVSGRTGLVVIDHGDGRIEAGGLFNGGPKGSGLALLDFVIENYGVNYVECFAPLHEVYARLGFVVTNQSPWNNEYRPDHWHPSLGTPDYYEMAL